MSGNTRRDKRQQRTLFYRLLKRKKWRVHTHTALAAPVVETVL